MLCITQDQKQRPRLGQNPHLTGCAVAYDTHHAESKAETKARPKPRT